MSPFFIPKSIFSPLNFSYSLIPKYALFTMPFQSGYSWSKNLPLWVFGIMFKAPFSLFASSKDAQAATIRSAGPKGKYARSWCMGWRELPPIPGGLLMNIVCTDLIFYPQKLFRQGMSLGLVQQLWRTSSNWKSCSFVMEAYPLSYLPLFFLTRAMSLTTCMPGGLDIRKRYGESFLSQQSRNLCFHIWMSLSLRKFLMIKNPFSSQKSLCYLVRQPESVVQRQELELDVR